MKKKGFTLAEILITLGIVGVVAALTAPALVKNTAGAKVGPTLAKVVNTMDVANEQLMIDKNISDLAKVYGDNKELYFADLSKYIRKAGYNSTKSTTVHSYNATHNPTGGGTSYTGEFLLPEGASIYSDIAGYDDYAASYGSLKGEWLTCYVDINGSGSGNNMRADDVFVFALDRTGVMVPYGSQIAHKAYGRNLYTWQGHCDKNIVDHSAQECAGSIFENNLKVIYQ